MKYVIGLSGTHGTGKSTVAREAAALGVPVNRAQLSREAQEALGWSTLAGARERLDTMWQLQGAILSRLVARDEAIARSRTLTLVERSPADVWAYTQVWLSRHGVDWKNDPQSLQYLADLGAHAREHYAKIIYVPMRDSIPFVEEPNRADLLSRESVAKNVQDFIWAFRVPEHVLLELSPERRGREVRDLFAEETEE